MSTTTFKGYRISAEYLGNKAAPWNDGKSEENYNNHRVTVTNTRTKARTSFEFWASIAYPEVRSPSDLCDAFSCFLSDAMMGKESFDEFCSNFGYDTDSRKAEQAWKSCQKAAEKADRVISGDLYALANALNDREAA